MQNLFKIITGLIFSFLLALSVSSQENYKDVSAADSAKIYPGGTFYNVITYNVSSFKSKPKNVILMIGDGMGISHLFAGMTANGGKLFLQNFKSIGLCQTQSADNYVTDSAAGGTALATGKKTYNGAVGVDENRQPAKNIREKIEAHKMATGVVSTSAITHATPASFVAHQPSRKMYEAIAADFLNTDIDVFIGGGYKHFTEREDKRNLVDELKKRGYAVHTDIEKIKQVKKGKLAGLTAPEHNARYPERGNLLPEAAKTALNILDNDNDGFFLMVEGSQIDWGGHQNDAGYVINEILDFDRAIGVALDFAAKNRETLIIVTADHETGGMSIENGNIENGMLISDFTTKEHTGILVPVFAFGPGADQFTGFMDNTDIPKKILTVLGY